MKEHRWIFLVGSALLLASSLAACGQPVASLPLPTPPPAQPPAAVESPSPAQPPQVDEIADEEGWHTVETFTGKASETTAPFHVSGTEWRIVWTADASYPEHAVLDIFVYSEDRYSLFTRRISHSDGSGSGTVYIDEGDGDYHIEVIAANLRSWTIAVQDHATVDDVAGREEWDTVEVFTGTSGETTPPFHVSGKEWRITWTVDAQYPEDAVLELFVYSQDAPYAIWDSVSHAGGSGGEVTYFIPWYIPYDEAKRGFFIRVMARNLRSWTITVEDDVVDVAVCPVQITDIHYNGTVYPRGFKYGSNSVLCLEVVEPDEYVVIKNLGDSCQEMSDWVLKNVSKGRPSFTFPSGFVLCPGNIIRVYTGFPVAPGGCRECGIFAAYAYVVDEQLGHIRRMYALYPLRFDYGPGDVWDNEKPDTAVLYNADGEEVSRKSYVVPSEDECYR